MGATPDGKVSCDCCGRGVIEIKCPFCHKGDSIQLAMDDKKFCLKIFLVRFAWILIMHTITKFKRSCFFVM